MKSIHLAKADFLRRLASYAKDLYELGDFTSEDPKRALLSSKIEGFIDAGTLIEVVTSAEIQKVIDTAHFEKFGEERHARRNRILEERAMQQNGNNLDEEVDWDVYDSPAKDRKR
jgi:Zn-finger domain-containing protein